MTLTTRLSVFFSSMLAIVLVGFSVGIYLLADLYLHRQAAERLDTVLNTISGAIEAGPAGIEWEPANRHLNLDFSSLGDSVIWFVVDDQGQMVDRSKGQISEEFLSNQALAVELRSSTDDSTKRILDSWETGQRRFGPDNHLPNRADAQHFGAPDDGPLYAALSVTAAVSLTPVHATLRQLAMALLALSFGIGSAAFFASRYVCRRALLPVNRMAFAAGEIDAHDLSQRLPAITTHDEVGVLNRSFNTLLDRLQIAFEQQQRFTGDASHQLRTPLTVILGQIDVALRRDRSPQEYRNVLLTAQRKAGELAKVVESLLFLARAESEARPPCTEQVDLAVWLPQHIHSWAEHVRSGDIVCGASESGHCSVNAHPVLLGELINILLDNACKYSDRGTPIKVCLERTSDAIWVVVEDQGHGISDSDMKNLFVPFFRSAETRRLGVEGSGLGLSIAKRLSEAVGATLTVVSQSNQGSCFKLRFSSSMIAGAGHCPDRDSGFSQTELLPAEQET